MPLLATIVWSFDLSSGILVLPLAVCLQLVLVDGGNVDFTIQSQYLCIPPVCPLLY
jgi:hypothetical protein